MDKINLKLRMMKFLDDTFEILLIIIFLTWMFGWFSLSYDYPYILLISTILVFITHGLSVVSRVRLDLQLKILTSSILKEIKNMNKEELKLYLDELYPKIEYLDDEVYINRLLIVINHRIAKL